MQRLVVAGLAGVAAAGAWWLLSGPEPGPSPQAPARAGAPVGSQAGRDLYAPRGVASSARAAERGPEAAGPAPPGAAPAAASGRVASTGTSAADPRDGGSSLTDERLRGGGSRSSGRVTGTDPGSEPPIDSEPLEDELLEEDEDVETDPEEVVTREAAAAALAEQMGLLDEATLERRVERAMRGDDALPSDEARNRVLADALVGLYLLSQKFPDTPIEQLRSMPMPGDPMASLSPARRNELLALARDHFSAA